MPMFCLHLFEAHRAFDYLPLQVPIANPSKQLSPRMATRDTLLELFKHRFVVSFPSDIEFDRWYHNDHATRLVLSMVESILYEDAAEATEAALCKDRLACDSRKSVAFSSSERAR